jgi:hypothetical protein
MTVGQVDMMSMAEYIGWQEFYAIEPWGLAVQDAMQAQGASILAEVNRNPKARSEVYGLREFLLFAGKKPPVPQALVEGKTAAQWKLIFAAEALATSRKAK